MTTTVVFTRAGTAYTVRFRYDPRLVELLKATVPAYARSWSKVGKTWSVEADWAEPLAAAMRSAGFEVVDLDDTLRRARTHEGMDWAHALFTAVGPTRVPAVHRAL